jgi:hypothetical protein
MDNSFRLLDMTVYGRKETWEDSLTGWPQRFKGNQVNRTDGSPTAQRSWLKAGRSDDLGTGSADFVPAPLQHQVGALSDEHESAGRNRKRRPYPNDILISNKGGLTAVNNRRSNQPDDCRKTLSDKRRPS